MNTERNPKSKNNAGGIPILSLILHYRAIVKKTACDSHKIRQRRPVVKNRGHGNKMTKLC